MAKVDRATKKTVIDSGAKYELAKKRDERGLYQIKALRSFGNVRKGALGGYVASDTSLSHEGTCWIDKDSSIRVEGRVAGNAQLVSSHVYDRAIATGDSRISNSILFHRSTVTGWDTCVYKSHIMDSARIDRGAQVERSTIRGCAELIGCNANIKRLEISGNAWIEDVFHLLQIGPIGTDADYLMVWRAKGEQGQEYVQVKRGCFCGTLAEFEKRVNKHEDRNIKSEYKSIIPLIKKRFKGLV